MECPQNLWHDSDCGILLIEISIKLEAAFQLLILFFCADILTKSGCAQLYKARPVHRLQEFCRQGQAEVISKSMSTILATCERQLSRVLYVKGTVGTGDIPGRFSEHDGRKRSHKLAPIRLFLVLPSSFSLRGHT